MRERATSPIVRVMRRSTTKPVVLPLACGLAAALTPFIAIRTFGDRHVMPGMYVHFIGVGVSALVAALASLTLTVVGARRNDGRTVIVGMAFSVMAALLAIHGLATPGVLVGMNGVISFTGGATLPVGAALLALCRPSPAFAGRKSVRALLALAGGSARRRRHASALIGMLFPTHRPGGSRNRQPRGRERTPHRLCALPPACSSRR